MRCPTCVVCLTPCASFVNGNKTGMLLEACAGKLDEQLEENFHEVMNVISTILTRGDARERLDAVVPGLARVPPEAAALLGKPRARLDLDVEITGYAKGKLTFLVA